MAGDARRSSTHVKIVVTPDKGEACEGARRCPDRGLAGRGERLFDPSGLQERPGSGPGLPTGPDSQPSADSQQGERTATSQNPPKPKRSASPDERAADDTAPLLMSSGGQLIISSPRRACDDETDPYLRLSDDRGKSFRTVELDSEVTAVLALEVMANDRIVVLATDGSCRTVGYESRDRGRSWDSVTPKGRWHLDKSPDARRVQSPDGSMATPCVPRAMSTVRNDVVRLLCPDGRILSTPDEQTWTVVGRLKGAAAFRFPIPDVGFALAPQANCEAAVMRTTDSGATWEQLTCLEGEPPRGISGQDGRYAAVVGDSVQVSNDGAESWRTP